MNTIQLSELRMGNLVTVNNPNSWPELKDIPMRVIGAAEKLDEFFPESKGDVSVVDPEGEVYHQFDQFILPIPLSEEWLKKFGFEFERQTVGGFERWETIHGVHKAHIKLLDKKFSWAIGEYTQHILYVHQLQNLYFTLTGTELTVTESEPPNRE